MTLAVVGEISKNQDEITTCRQAIIKASQYIPQPTVQSGPAPEESILTKATKGLFKFISTAGSHETVSIERVDNNLNERRMSSIGFGAGKLCYVSGYPQEGHGHKARQLPTLQFLSSRYQPIFTKLGLASLADFLGAMTVPAVREMVSKITGIPRHVLFLATLRAELLDLPLDRQPCQPPHINDVLLFSLLGIQTVGQLAALQKASQENPIQADLLLKLITIIQKAKPEYCGRQRITRVEMRDWGLAAERRGSDILLSDDDSEESAAERALATELQIRTQDPKDILWTAILKLQIIGNRDNLIRDNDLEENLSSQLPREYQLAFRYYKRVKLRFTPEQEAIFKDYLVQDQPHSLLYQLWPRLAPTAENGHFIYLGDELGFFPSDAALMWQPQLLAAQKTISATTVG